jgi:archaellum component FlaF (FlaF/FlaG flagellin family)
MDIKLIIAGVLLITAFASGWGLRNRDFKEYKVEVENAAKAQEAKVESITKQQELVTKSIEKEYDAKLALLRNYYANGVRQSSASKLSTNGNTSINIDDFTTNGLLIKCAETTQQLVSLQSWINEQIAIK